MNVRRAKTEAIAKKRFKLFTNIYNTLGEFKPLLVLGRYRKWNGNCTCRMCRVIHPRYNRAKEKRKVQDDE